MMSAICHFMFYNNFTFRSHCKLNCSWSALPCQEPMLVFPYRFASRLVTLPTEARMLGAVKPAKRKDYLHVAQALLQMHPSEATKRSVLFLMDLCKTYRPEDGPRLQWLEGEVDTPQIQLGLPSVLGRIAPVMRLKATVGR